MNPCIAIQDEVELAKYPDLWSINPATFGANQAVVWTTLLAAVENFAAAAEDISDMAESTLANTRTDADMDGNSGVNEGSGGGGDAVNNPWIGPARSYLRYFYTAMRKFYDNNATAVERSPDTAFQTTEVSKSQRKKEKKRKKKATVTAAEVELKKRQLKAEQDVFKTLEILEGHLTLLFIDDPSSFDPISIPPTVSNHDIVELVIQAKYFSLAESDRPTDLAALENMLQGTHLYEKCMSGTRNDDKFWANAMPYVAFICLGHKILQVGCSQTRWRYFTQLKDATSMWRNARFADINRKEKIRIAGSHVREVFDMQKRNVPNFHNLDCRTIVRTVWTALKQQGDTNHAYAFDHSGEAARAFCCAGKKIFQPIPRCWKCRFVHLYDAGREETFQDGQLVDGDLHANLEVVCGEDLCHYFCSEEFQATRTPVLVAPELEPFSLTIY